MRQTIALGALFLFLAGTAAAQNVGDHATAGYNPQRTGLNAHMGNFNAPLRMIRSLTLGGVDDARGCTAFEDFLVVGESSDGVDPVRYSLFDLRQQADVLTPLLTTTFLGTEEMLNFTPSYANDILLLGGPATSTVKAIRVSVLSEIWQDVTVGSSQGRHPVVTGDLALYAGDQKVAARQASTGITLWEVDSTVGEAPLVMQGDRAYVLQQDGTLNAHALSDGSTLWSLAFIGSAGSSLAATEKYVFATNPVASAYGAIRVSDQTLAWVETDGFTLAPGGLALGYDRLYVFLEDNGAGAAEIRVHDPDNGDLLTVITEDGSGLRFPSLLNNNLVYALGDDILIRDAFSGVLLARLPAPDLRGLVGHEGQLFALFPEVMEIWEPSGEIFFPQIADGEGQSTLITLVNLGFEEANGQVDFIGIDGQPLSLPIAGVGGTDSSVEFVIPPRSSLRVQTGSGNTLQRGWAVVSADQDVRGSALFQFSSAGTVLFEAGVAQSTAVGEALVFIQKDIGLSPVDGVTEVNFSTGVALANPSQQDAEVEMTLVDDDGVIVATITLPLAAGNQDSRFIEEFFPDDVGETFEGTLRLSSDVPVIVTSLRTSGGFQLSSLPAGQAR